jgi:hypothetical protein
MATGGITFEKNRAFFVEPQLTIDECVCEHLRGGFLSRIAATHVTNTFP